MAITGTTTEKQADRPQPRSPQVEEVGAFHICPHDKLFMVSLSLEGSGWHPVPRSSSIQDLQYLVDCKLAVNGRTGKPLGAKTKLNLALKPGRTAKIGEDEITIQESRCTTCQDFRERLEEVKIRQTATVRLLGNCAIVKLDDRADEVEVSDDTTSRSLALVLARLHADGDSPEAEAAHLGEHHDSVHIFTQQTQRIMEDNTPIRSLGNSTFCLLSDTTEFTCTVRDAAEAFATIKESSLDFTMTLYDGDQSYPMFIGPGSTIHHVISQCSAQLPQHLVVQWFYGATQRKISGEGNARACLVNASGMEIDGLGHVPIIPSKQQVATSRIETNKTNIASGPKSENIVDVIDQGLELAKLHATDVSDIAVTKGSEMYPILSNSFLNDIFPFYFRISEETIIAAGPSLTKLVGLPTLCGQNPQNLFDFVRPDIPFDASIIKDMSSFSVTIRVKYVRGQEVGAIVDGDEDEVRLGGQMVALQRDGADPRLDLIFLGYMQCQQESDVLSRGLTMQDFSKTDNSLKVILMNHTAQLSKANNATLIEALDLLHAEKKRNDNLIEQLRLQYRQLQAAATIATESTRFKSEFVATLSHELRTPLHVILGMCELLLMTELTEAQIEYGNGINTGAEHLLRMVNSVLDFSKNESGQLELDIDEFYLITAVEDVLNLFKFVVQQNELDLHLYIDTRLGQAQMIEGDRKRLQQILLNLIGNAAKFTHEGFIELYVDVVPLQEGDHPDDIRLQFDIKDTGIGIAEDDLVRIFLPFQQADSTDRRKYGGTGLGLSICTQLTELMAGDIWATSTVGVGTTFSFTIRARKCGNPDGEVQNDTALAVPIVLAYNSEQMPKAIKRTLDRHAFTAPIYTFKLSEFQLARRPPETKVLVLDDDPIQGRALEIVKAVSKLPDKDTMLVAVLCYENRKPEFQGFPVRCIAKPLTPTAMMNFFDSVSEWCARRATRRLSLKSAVSSEAKVETASSSLTEQSIQRLNSLMSPSVRAADHITTEFGSGNLRTLTSEALSPRVEFDSPRHRDMTQPKAATSCVIPRHISSSPTGTRLDHGHGSNSQLLGAGNTPNHIHKVIASPRASRRAKGLAGTGVTDDDSSVHSLARSALSDHRLSPTLERLEALTLFKGSASPSHDPKGRSVSRSSSGELKTTSGIATRSSTRTSGLPAILEDGIDLPKDRTFHLKATTGKDRSKPSPAKSAAASSRSESDELERGRNPTYQLANTIAAKMTSSEAVKTPAQAPAAPVPESRFGLRRQSEGDLKKDLVDGAADAGGEKDVDRLLGITKDEGGGGNSETSSQRSHKKTAASGGKDKDQGGKADATTASKSAAKTSKTKTDKTDQPDATTNAKPFALVVDDNKMNCVILKKMLGACGVDSVSELNGQLGYDQWISHQEPGARPIDIIFMDCQMPIVDGYEATRMIRTHEEENGIKRTPIVAVTADALPYIHTQCEGAGMDAVITKPARKDKIKAMVSEMGIGVD